MNDDLQTTREGETDLVAGISQIPGLSPVLKGPPDEKNRGRRVGVLESDSEYVKLAKQGGHKGLLWHEETLTTNPHTYKRPEWFGTSSGDISPSLINSEEKKSPRAFQRREPPFGSDNMSAWERDDTSDGKEKNNNAPDSETAENLPRPKFEISKFKRIVYDKKPGPVDMSKLLSFGYAGNGKSTASTDVSN